MFDHVSRREFLRQAAAAGTASVAVGAVYSTTQPVLAARSPNEKLNIACIGVAAQGAYDMNNVASENIVALCDVDAQRLGKAADRFPQAKTYADFRKLLDQKDIDAVVVSTPDHTHAIPVVWRFEAWARRLLRKAAGALGL